MNDPRYPIGKFKFDGPPSEAERNKFIDDIEHAPAALRAAKAVNAFDVAPLSHSA